MNFHETKMGSHFFNCQIPELIKALREIAAALSKPAPAVIQLAETGEPDFLHNLFYGNHEPDIYGCVTVPSRLDQNVKEAEKALLPALGQSQRLFLVHVLTRFYPCKSLVYYHINTAPLLPPKSVPRL